MSVVVVGFELFCDVMINGLKTDSEAGGKSDAFPSLLADENDNDNDDDMRSPLY